MTTLENAREFLNSCGIKDKSIYVPMHCENRLLSNIIAGHSRHIIQSIIQDLSIQRNVSPEVLEYLSGKV